MTATEYTFTKFGVDSSIRFPVIARTNRQTDTTECPTHTGGYAGVGNCNPDMIPGVKRSIMHVSSNCGMLCFRQCKGFDGPNESICTRLRYGRR